MMDKETRKLQSRLYIANQPKKVHKAYTPSIFTNETIDLARGLCLPDGYRVDQHPNGAWAWQRIDQRDGTEHWPEYDTVEDARRGAWADFKGEVTTQETVSAVD